MAILASAVWRVRPSGNNLNGGGYDTGIAGAATDYSQQNAAQAIGTNGATTGAGVTTFTDATAGAFTSAMVGNCIQIASGTNFQAGFYFVTAFTNANSVVLDRTPTSGGAGSAGVWKLGGGWADFITNTTFATSQIVSGNTIFVLGSGTPNPAGYVYDYTVTSAFHLIEGSTLGEIILANDPLTPGYKAPPDTTGGMPTVKVNTVAANFIQIGCVRIAGLWFIANAMNAGKSVIIDSNTQGPNVIFGCVFDQLSSDAQLCSTNQNAYGFAVVGCEVYSSNSTTGGANYAVSLTGSQSAVIVNCNIHDAVGKGVNLNIGSISNSIIAKCFGSGITIGNNGGFVMNNTIDANGGSGIAAGAGAMLINNIVSNHVTGGTFGINAGPNLVLADYTVFYNNTTDYSNSLPYSAHDTHGGSNPYVGQPTEDYDLA
jgi:hypothetical protein